MTLYELLAVCEGCQTSLAHLTSCVVITHHGIAVQVGLEVPFYNRSVNAHADLQHGHENQEPHGQVSCALATSLCHRPQCDGIVLSARPRRQFAYERKLSSLGVKTTSSVQTIDQWPDNLTK